jgi:hypothetical protein
MHKDNFIFIILHNYLILVAGIFIPTWRAASIMFCG